MTPPSPDAGMNACPYLIPQAFMGAEEMAV
ncbi:MAG: hypothetical protein QOF85_2415 [Solirubrobacterales bacterium]|jgi:hypothetical protein|nr:hypothetical protein [Solirubrobacterales bacterium]